MPSLRTVRRTGLGIGVFLVVAALVLAMVAWGQVRRTMPTDQGSLTLPGLSAEVTVIRDERGVPHIYADTMQDLMRGQGFVQAQDRFFEMDKRRRITAGRLSEMVGEAGVETDKAIRTMGWRRVAEAELPLLSPDTRQALQAFSEGVNAWIDSKDTNGEMALEYTILGQQVPDYRVDPWTEADSLAWLKAMAWDLKGNYDGELTRARLPAQVSAAMIADLYPPYPTEQHAPILSSDQWKPAERPVSRRQEQMTSRSDGRVRLEHEPTGAQQAYADTTTAIDAIPPLLGQGEGIGSNSWVVSGERSSTGKPLLANDPHLGVSMPGIWYQMGLHCTEVTEACPMDVSGFSLAGVPGIIIGHNAKVAWGFTNLAPDVTDFYLEDVRDDRYLRDGQLEPLTTRTETIKVAGGEDVPLTIRSTVHGPLLSDATEGVRKAGTDVTVTGRESTTYAVALAWTALTPSRTADAIFALNTAADFDDFRAAAKLFAVPSQNLLYADVEGNIGYQAPGAVPVRGAKVGDYPAGYVPMPGWDSRYDWKGTVPFDDMPWVYNPPEGFVVAANQQVTASSSPFLTTEWDYGYRSQRIRDLLTSEPKVTPAKMARIQVDDRNEFAPRLVSHLTRVEVKDPFVAEAQDLLREWDFTQPTGRSDASAAAAYYNAVWSHVVRITFNDDLPADLQASGGSLHMQSIDRLLDKPRSAWWDNRQTPGVIEGRDEVLRQALRDARFELTRTLGKDIDSWDWGKLHTVTFRHEVLGGDAVPGLVQRLFNRGGDPVAGGTSIVNAMSWDASEGYAVTSAPSMRMVVDLGDLDASRWVTMTGNSGRPFSDHYSDQFEAWRDGELYPWPASREAVEKAGRRTLTLVPGESSG